MVKKNRFIRWEIKNVSINGKYMFFFTIFIIIPFMVISMYTYNQLKFNTVNREETNAIQTLNMVMSLVNLKNAEYEANLFRIYDENEVLNIMEMSTTSAKIDRILNTITAKDSNIVCAVIVNQNNKVFKSRKQSVIQLDINKINDLLVNSESTNKTNWVFGSILNSNSYNSDSNHITCSIALKNIYNELKEIGFLITEINLQYLDDLCSNVIVSPKGLLIITDSENKILWHENKEWVGKNISSYGFVEKATLVNDNKMFSFTIDDDKYNVVCKQSTDSNNWKYYTLIPKSDITKQIMGDLLYFYLSIIIIIILLIFNLILNKRYIIKPIQKLILIVDIIDGKNDLIDVKHDFGNDEIGFLFKSIKQANVRIADLIINVKEVEKQKLKREIDYLKSQINPHFIYNTLDIIYWMAKEKKEEKISEAIKILTDILRYLINFNKEYATINEEISNLKKYIQIQRFWYGDSFGITYDIDESLLLCKTQKLTIQPFVENIFIHNSLQEGVLIKISIMDEGSSIIIKIEDNGKGISKRRIDEIFDTEMHGVGIYSIHNLLKLNYSGDYGVNILSEEGNGTIITIIIPKIV